MWNLSWSAYASISYMQNLINAPLTRIMSSSLDILFPPMVLKWTQQKWTLSPNGRCLHQSMIFRHSLDLPTFTEAFTWTPEAERAFQQLKVAFSSAPILR